MTDQEKKDFKEITGFDTPEEQAAYEQGRKHEQDVILTFIAKWDGGANSALGAMLNSKFFELKDVLKAPRAAMTETLIEKHERLKKELYAVELEIAKWMRNNKDKIDWSGFGGGSLVEFYKYGISNLKKPPHEIDHESQMPTYGKAG